MPLYLVGAEAALQLARWGAFERWLDAADVRLAELPADWPYRAAFGQAILEFRARGAQLLGMPDQAALHLGRAAELAREWGDADASAAHAVAVANLWLVSDDHAMLEAHVADALREHADARGERLGALELCLGTSFVVRGRWIEGADARAREVLTPLLEREDLLLGDRARARLRLAEVELRSHDLERAAALLDTARTELADGLAGGDDVERGMLAMLEARLARQRAERMPSAERAAAYEQALAAVGAVLDERIARWSALPLEDGGVGFLHSGEERGLLSELLQLELAASGGGATGALQHVARVHALATRHRRAGRPAPDRVDPQRLGLAPREGALVYLPAMEQSHLFLVDATGTQHVALVPVGVINLRRAAFERDFDPTSATVPAAAARALAEVLLPAEAAARIATWDAVSVVGLDLLRYVPFELLPLPDGATLGERCAVAYQPDLVTACWLAERPRATRAPTAPWVAWVGAPELGPELPPLSLDGDDRAALGAGAAGHVLAFEGDRADAAALERAATSGAAVLHVLTHGAPGPGTGTGIALADADAPHRVLSASDVVALPEVPPVVILSACRAARGASRLGEAGLDGLAGAFLERGARCVLMPYEDVELSAVLELVSELQPRLLAGDTSVAGALRSARMGIAERGGTPATASLLHAIGRAHEPLAPQRD